LLCHYKATGTLAKTAFSRLLSYCEAVRCRNISEQFQKSRAGGEAVIALNVVLTLFFGYDKTSLGKQVPNEKAPLSRK